MIEVEVSCAQGLLEQGPCRSRVRSSKASSRDRTNAGLLLVTGTPLAILFLHMPAIFTVKIEVLPQRVRDLLTSAFEGGINYWCACITIDKYPDDTHCPQSY